MGGGSGEQWVFRLAKKTPSRTAAPRLAPSRRNPTSLEPKTPIPTAPRKKAGPQVLQNRERRRASSRLHSPRSTSWAMVRAPAGYPPISPSTKAAAPAPPTPNRRYIHRDRGRAQSPATPVSMSREESTKKGKREGMSTSKHSVMPSRAACKLSSGKANSSPPMQSRPAPSTKIRRYPFMVHPPSNMLIRMRLSLKSCLPLLGLRPEMG